MLFVTCLASVYFFINGVFGDPWASFLKHQSHDLACDAGTRTDFGIVGNVIACSRICGDTVGCRGFHFDETDGRCWGSDQTRCQAVPGAVYYDKNCGAPPAIQNADVSDGGILAGDTRTYTCSPGCVLRNAVTMDTTCQPDSSWSATSFSCLWDCGDPPTVPHAANVSDGDTVQGTYRWYTCEEGYVPSPYWEPIHVLCQAQSSWTAVRFSCLIDCYAPPLIENATRSSSYGSTLEGSARSYDCLPGYFVNDTDTTEYRTSLSIRCQANGTWATVEFPCTLACGAIPVIWNGKPVKMWNTRYGEYPLFLEYGCPYGYVLAEPFNSTAWTWVRNEIIKRWAYTYTYTYTYMNTYTYSYVSLSNRTGLECVNETWTDPYFECVLDCRAPPFVENAIITEGESLINMTRVYSCLPGYVLNDNVTGTWNETIVVNTTCQQNGQWSNVSFECVPVCGTPPELANGLAVDMWTDGNLTFLDYGCDVGYVMAEGYIIIRELCGTPPELANGLAVDMGTVGNRTFLDYGCDDDYAMAEAYNSTAVECDNGTWSEPFVECIRDCREPPLIENATASLGESLENMTRVYSCLPGYVLNDNVTGTWNETIVLNTTCQPDGQWSDVNFVCVPVCGTLPEIANGSAVDMWTDGNRMFLDYGCDDDYAMAEAYNSTVVECLNGTWEELYFMCLRVCGTLPEIANGSAVDMWTDGNRMFLDYGCDDDYAMAEAYNSTVVECLNGTWEELYFMCLRDCYEPPSIENATLSAGGTLEGLTRNYTCIPESIVRATPVTTVCLPDGTWTTVDLQCLTGECPPEWQQIGSSCYIVAGNSTIPVVNSLTFCQATYPTYKTYMFQLETAEEDVAVVTNILQNYAVAFCLGLHDPLVNTNWEWMATNEPMTYSNWLAGQPDGPPQSYVYVSVSDNYQWRDWSDTITCQPLCEISLI